MGRGLAWSDGRDTLVLRGPWCDECVRDGGGGRHGAVCGECDRRLILCVLVTDPSEPSMLCDIAAGA